jgi:hypothetical protein
VTSVDDSKLRIVGGNDFDPPSWLVTRLCRIDRLFRIGSLHVVATHCIPHAAATTMAQPLQKQQA